MGLTFAIMLRVLLLSAALIVSFGFELEDGDYQDDNAASESAPPVKPAGVPPPDYSKFKPPADYKPPAPAKSKIVTTEEEIRKMRVKQLRKFLYDRDITCKGCAEKDDFVKLAIENREKPTKEEKDKTLDELLASMKGMPGMGNFKMYGKDDIANMADLYADKDRRACQARLVVALLQLCLVSRCYT